MRTQAVYIEQARTWGDSGPLQDKLNVADPVSAIDVIIEATNGATSNQGNPLHTDVDRVEIIDGSDRLFSLSLAQGIVQHAYEHGRYPSHILTEAANGVQMEGFRILFGRHLGDEEYWLDPGMFRNLMYRLTGDLTISATAGFATGTRRVTIIAHTMPRVPGGRAGFFMTKEMNQFTTVASGDQRIDLPSDFPHRMLGVRSFETGITFDAAITNLKLTKGKDSFVYFDLASDDFRRALEQWRGDHEISMLLFRTDADAPSVLFPEVRSISVTALQDFDVATIDAITADQATLQLLTLSATPTIAKSSTDRSIRAYIKGSMPLFGGVWPLGDPNDPNDWLQGEDIRDLELVLTQGNAGGAASVWLQQVRP